MNGNLTSASIEMRMAERRGSRGRASGNELALASMETRLTEPRYEAAFFYGLFLRGHPLEKLRRDIDVPRLKHNGAVTMDSSILGSGD